MASQASSNAEDSAESLVYDLYLDTVNPPLALGAGDLPFSEMLVTLLPDVTYYWKVVARNGCGETESAVRSIRITSLDIVSRYESVVSLASSRPERTFEAASLPWADPDDVLEPGAPPVLLYSVTFPDTVISKQLEVILYRLIQNAEMKEFPYLRY